MNNNHNDNHIILILVSIMFVVTMSSVLFAISINYNTYLKQETERLYDFIFGQKYLIEVFAQESFTQEIITQKSMDSDINTQDEKILKEFLAKIIVAHNDYEMRGNSSEFLLAQLKDNKVFYILNSHYDKAEDAQKSLIKTGSRPYLLQSKNLSQPMKLALSGKTGSMINYDYRGDEVVAVYAPLIIGKFQLGMVAKIDIDEIRMPFIKAAIITIFVVLLIVAIGARFFLRNLNPIIISLRETTKILEESLSIAQDATQSKSDFLANMSHEIRTPLNAVIGMNYLALQTQLNSFQYNYVNKAYTAAQGLLRIIDDILDFSKIEAGKLEIEKVDFYLKDVLDNLESMIKLLADKKGIKFSVNIAPDIPEVLSGDPLRLTQVLTNLANNAVKFTRESGLVEIKVSLGECKEERFNLIFSVIDNGIGLSEEQQKKLFQAFNQADVSTTRKYGGTGLGLTISKNLVELMDGKIWLESHYHVGSNFQFSIPFAKQANTSIARNLFIKEKENKLFKQAVEQLYGIKVLLVEDTIINQELVKELLISEGVIVETVSNGLDAVLILESSSFDLVLMDCQMPIMDGYLATQKIREQARFKDLPIIATTANVMPESIQKAMDAGMNDFIAKPINVQQLFIIMAKWYKSTKQTSLLIKDKVEQPSEPQLKLQPKQQAESEKKAIIEQKVPDISSVDVSAGLAYCNGNVDFYIRMLKMFRDNNADFEQKLMETIEKELNSEQTTKIAHSLVGQAGTIGALDLMNAAKSLEISSKKNTKINKDLIAAVVAKLKVIIQSIDKYSE